MAATHILSKTTKQEWLDIVGKCQSVETYISILMILGKDNIFNQGRKKVVIEFTRSVCSQNPKISSHLIYILNLYLSKFYQNSNCKLILESSV